MRHPSCGVGARKLHAFAPCGGAHTDGPTVLPCASRGLSGCSSSEVKCVGLVLSRSRKQKVVLQGQIFAQPQLLPLTTHYQRAPIVVKVYRFW